MRPNSAWNPPLFMACRCLSGRCMDSVLTQTPHNPDPIPRTAGRRRLSILYSVPLCHPHPARRQQKCCVQPLRQGLLPQFSYPAELSCWPPFEPAAPPAISELSVNQRGPKAGCPHSTASPLAPCTPRPTLDGHLRCVLVLAPARNSGSCRSRRVCLTPFPSFFSVLRVRPEYPLSIDPSIASVAPADDSVAFPVQNPRTLRSTDRRPGG
jgi:hypothetical protein